MLECSIQLLACEFRVATDVEAVIAHVDRVRPGAIQDHPVRRRHRLEVQRDGDGYRIREDDRDPESVADLDAVTGLLDRRFHELAFDGLADFTKLHAGCARWFGRRFLVVGNRGAGKTTLMARLLFEGCAVEGDEMVLIKDGQAIAYPRRFGIRQRTLRLIPALGALAPHLTDDPDIDDPHGYHVLAVDPAALGFEWRITSGRVDAVFFFAARHDAPARIAHCPAQTMAQHVMRQSAPPRGGSGAWIRDVGALVRDAATYEMVAGDLDSTVASVRECVLGV